MGYIGWSKFSTIESTEELLPALDEETTINIMGAIQDKYKYCLLQTMQYAGQIKQTYASQGMMVDDKALMNHILPQIIKLFTEADQSAYDEFGVDSNEVEEAVSYYINSDPTSNTSTTLKTITKKIKQMYTELGGELESSELNNNNNTIENISTKNKYTKTKKSKRVKNVKSKNNTIEIESISENEEESDVIELDDITILNQDSSSEIKTVDGFVEFINTMSNELIRQFDIYFDEFTNQYGIISESSPKDKQEKFQIGMLTAIQKYYYNILFYIK